MQSTALSSLCCSQEMFSMPTSVSMVTEVSYQGWHSKQPKILDEGERKICTDITQVMYIFKYSSFLFLIMCLCRDMCTWLKVSPKARGVEFSGSGVIGGCEFSTELWSLAWTVCTQPLNHYCNSHNGHGSKRTSDMFWKDLLCTWKHWPK